MSVFTSDLEDHHKTLRLLAKTNLFATVVTAIWLTERAAHYTQWNNQLDVLVRLGIPLLLAVYFAVASWEAFRKLRKAA